MRFTTLAAVVILGTATVASAQVQAGVQSGSLQSGVQGGGPQTGVQAGSQTGVRGGMRGGVQAPPDIGAPLVLEIGVRQYGADNRIGGSASNSGTSSTGKFESYVWTSTSLCGMSASNTEPTSVPGVGWHFTGTVLSNSSRGLDVRVDWQRMWDRGQRVQNGSSGSQTITLREGERIELDRVLPVGQSPCGAVEAKLEASVASQPAYRLAVMNGRLAMAGARGGRGMAGGMGQQGQFGQQGQQGQVGQQGQQGQVGQQGQQAIGGRGRGMASSTTSSSAVAGRGAMGRSMSSSTSTDVTAAGGRGGRGAGRGTGAGLASGAGTGTVTGAAAGAQAGVMGGRGRGTGAGGGTGIDPAMASAGAMGGRGNATANNTTSTTVMGARGGRGTMSVPDRAALGAAIARTQVGQGRGQVLFGQQSYEAELWLVHRKPDGNETVQQQTVRFGGPASTFGFPPVQVQTPKGAITIDINGKLQVLGGSEQPGQHITVSIDRRARASGPPLLDITGGSSMVIDVPSPTDVLSFEFPALQKSTEDLLKGHLFSLRVRVTPIGR